MLPDTLSEWQAKVIRLEGKVDSLHTRLDNTEQNVYRELKEMHTILNEMSDAVQVQRDWRNRQLGALGLGGGILVFIGGLISLILNKIL